MSKNDESMTNPHRSNEPVIMRELDLHMSLSSDSLETEKSHLLPGDKNIFDPRATKNTISSLLGMTIVFGVLNSSGALEPLIFDALNNRSNNSNKRHKFLSHSNGYIFSARTNFSKQTVSSVNISWVFSVNLFFLLGAGIFAGCKVDRSGVKSLTYSSCALATISMFCFAKSGNKLANFIVLYGFFGVAQGVLMTCCFSGLSCWYSKNLATFSAAISLGGSIGGIVFPIFIRKSYAKFGYETTILIYGGIVAFLGIGCSLLCDDNFEERNLNTNKKDESFSDVCKIYFKDTINLKYFLSLKFIIISIGLSAAEIGTSIVATYLTSYCTKKGYSQQESYNFITIMNAFGLLGRFWGVIADRWLGKFQVIITCMMIAALSNFIFLLAFGKHTWAMYLFCAFYGSSISGFLSLCPTAVSSLCNDNDFGKRFSTMYLFAACTSIPLLEISGVIIGDQDSNIRYQQFWIFTSLILLLGSFCYLYLRISAVGLRWLKY
ncbi:hypothetical protein QEN19_003848 [Hanseniaspora menglaensis]